MKEGGIENQDDLKSYFLNVILPNATKLQSWNDDTNVMATKEEPTPCNKFAEKLLQCIKNVPLVCIMSMTEIC